MCIRPIFTTFLFLFIMVFFSPQLTLGTPGGHGGGGNSEDGGDRNSMDLQPISGGVSWGQNPNGTDVMGTSIWDGRPESIEDGPYQPDRAVEDAESALLQGLDDGQYTPEEVKEQLDWAQSVGIQISAQAQNFLNNINQPPSKPEKQSTDSGAASPPKPPPATKPSKIQRQNENVAEVLEGIEKIKNLLQRGETSEEIEKKIWEMSTEDLIKKRKLKQNQKPKPPRKYVPPQEDVRYYLIPFFRPLMKINY